MHIEINDNTTLQEIQGVFSDYYPYLRLEFYYLPHKKYEGSKKINLISPAAIIGDIRKTHVSGLLEIRPDYKVVDVEREFQKRFSLSAQILRREKDGWEQTTGMDSFSLKELNEIGRNSSDEFIISDYKKGIEEGELP